MSYCAIDFGTSNSAIAIPNGSDGMRLVPLEAGQPTMPTAVFYWADADEAGAPLATLPRAFGRAAVKLYAEGHDGRLMRSLKSLLGSSLLEQTTDIGAGRAVSYLDVIVGYLQQLRTQATAAAGAAPTRVVMGRPVFFVDDDPARDAQAQASLADAARRVGFEEVQFQFEPIAAAFDYERQATGEERVLVADIGGGTSDFSVVRVGPQRMARLERRDDILASHGVHIAGTDFDRRLELLSILPTLGYGGRLLPAPGRTTSLEVPSGVYFDLATWHLINTLYVPRRVAELRNEARNYADPKHAQRLMKVIDERLGHELAGRAEAAKIEVAAGGEAAIDLGHVERGLAVTLQEADARDALEADLARIASAALETARLAGVTPGEIDALYFTGGSTGLAPLTQRLAAAFPQARTVHGDRLASVATGLGLHAARVFG